jgi:hypothetical protein
VLASLGWATSRRVSAHLGGNSGAYLESISHRVYLREVAFEWELTKETIYLPKGCLQGRFVGEEGRGRETDGERGRERQEVTSPYVKHVKQVS